MAYTIGIISQKGGVGKSSIARLLARDFVAAEWSALIADFDVDQATSLHWHQRRSQSDIQPYVPVMTFRDVAKAVEEGGKYDVVIFDGLPAANRKASEIAQASDLVIIPTGPAIDDIQPSIQLAKKLVSQSTNPIPMKKITFVLYKVPDKAQHLVATAYHMLNDSGFEVLGSAIPYKPSYVKALDSGRSLTETSFRTMNDQASEVAQDVVNRLTKVTAGESAA